MAMRAAAAAGEAHAVGRVGPMTRSFTAARKTDLTLTYRVFIVPGARPAAFICLIQVSTSERRATGARRPGRGTPDGQAHRQHGAGRPYLAGRPGGGGAGVTTTRSTTSTEARPETAARFRSQGLLAAGGRAPLRGWDRGSVESSGRRTIRTRSRQPGARGRSSGAAPAAPYEFVSGPAKPRSALGAGDVGARAHGDEPGSHRLLC